MARCNKKQILKKKELETKNIYYFYDSYPASSASKHLHKPHTFAREESQGRDLSQATVNVCQSAQPITQSNIELGNNPSIRTWITHTHWLTTYGNIQECGENAF